MWVMKTLTTNEIARTAFKALTPPEWEASSGYKHPRRNKNEVCPYCKNEDTDVVRDVVQLEPFKQWYGDRVEKFTVVNCWCCSAVWSFYEASERTPSGRNEERI